MFRICSRTIGAAQTWMLCGQLAGHGVEALRSEWQCRGQAASSTLTLLDLSDVTFIDEAGEQLLREMRDRGVSFVAKGVETRHILDNLATGERPQLRRFLRPSGDGGCW